MWFLITVGACAGLAAGALQLFLSYVAPAVAAGNFIAQAPEPVVLGKQLSRRESHLVSALVHLVASTVFGTLYGLAVVFDWVSDFSLVAILAWSLMITLFAGLVLLPLEGHGLFGRRHDAWFFADSVLSHLFWGIAFYAIVQLWLVT